ncbi:PDR/VanB family oxidoreductase [Derxia lacustris]|uniref:PDR/VanB family oxidoreductase n=1 Tax=Derxia lacustris TaxID=764842 RepID=UPI00111BD221|nr:PDR/VanB family oxidoreductase [Derxia lacustris]
MTAGNALLRLRVAHRRQEANDIVSLELVDPAGAPLPAFSAGAHVDLHLPGGFVRQYSLCNAPAERHRYVVAVLRDPASRGGSAALHAQVNADDLLDVGLPRNLFPLVAGDHHSLLFGGGIGITPMLAMAEQLAAEGASFDLHYSARSREHAAFAARLGECAYADRVGLHFSHGSDAQRLDIAAVLAAAPAGTHVYACGPQRYLDAVIAAAQAAGIDAARLHHEHFGSAAAEARDGDAPFELECLRSGRVVTVRRDQTAAAALAEAGIELPLSCEQGVCGTCLVPVLAGQPDHRDLYLSPAEQAASNRFTPCCSRARTARLVIDL